MPEPEGLYALPSSYLANQALTLAYRRPIGVSVKIISVVSKS